MSHFSSFSATQRRQEVLRNKSLLYREKILFLFYFLFYHTIEVVLQSCYTQQQTAFSAFSNFFDTLSAAILNLNLELVNSRERTTSNVQDLKEEEVSLQRGFLKYCHMLSLLISPNKLFTSMARQQRIEQRNSLLELET